MCLPQLSVHGDDKPGVLGRGEWGSHFSVGSCNRFQTCRVKVYASSVDALIIIAPPTLHEQTGESLGYHAADSFIFCGQHALFLIEAESPRDWDQPQALVGSQRGRARIYFGFRILGQSPISIV